MNLRRKKNKNSGNGNNNNIDNDRLNLLSVPRWSLKNIIQTTRLILTRLVSLGFFNVAFLVFLSISRFRFFLSLFLLQRWNKNSIWSPTFGCRFTFRVLRFVFRVSCLVSPPLSSQSLLLCFQLALSLYLDLSIFAAGEKNVSPN